MRTPVLVGIGVASQREDDPLRALHPLALMTEAARAGADCGAPGLLPRLDRILVPRGRRNHANPGRAIGTALGVPGVHSALSTMGVLPQTLFGRACAAIAIADTASGRVLATATDLASVATFEGDRELVGSTVQVQGDQFRLAA